MKAAFLRGLCCLLVLAQLLPFAVLADTEETSESPKRIALTFDDGPHPQETDAILDLLERYGIPATFFVVGKNAELYPAPLKRAVSLGHEIGNHTFSHPKLRGKSAASLTEELEHTENIIRSLTNIRPLVFRPPEGFRDSVVRTVSDEQGYQLVYWTVDTLDWTSASASSIEKAILKNVKNGSIILCHDYISGKSHTVEALERVIPRLLEEGYVFVTVSTLLEVSAQ